MVRNNDSKRFAKGNLHDIFYRYTIARQQLSEDQALKIMELLRQKRMSTPPPVKYVIERIKTRGSLAIWKIAHTFA
jgi:hypothetical protein